MANTNKTNEYRQLIGSLIDQRRLREAISMMENLCRNSKNRLVQERLARTRDNYALMLRYVAMGADDPERDRIYTDIVNELYDELDTLLFEQEKAENPAQYYSIIRVREHGGAASADMPVMLAEYRDRLSQMSVLQLGPVSANSEELDNRRRMEGVQREMFNYLWTVPALSRADKDAVQNILDGQEYSSQLRVHIISALTLGLLMRFDAAKMSLLLTAYSGATDLRVQAAALVGVLIALWKHQHRPFASALDAQLTLARDSEHWHDDLRMAFIEMVRAVDTERINRTIQNEVIPGMMNIKPEIMDKINNGEFKMDDMSSLEANPEWQEMLDKSGITDKLKELTEMQLEGADVMMSTFAHLKSYPFFQDLSNWFLPYDAHHTALDPIVSRLGVLADMVDGAMFLCDSDKYSFVLTLNMVPEEQRKLMALQFQAQSDNIYRTISEMANSARPDAMRKMLNVYMQNIYRFFKLYRGRNEFVDPFVKGLNLVAVPSLADDFDDADLLAVMAEFYFKLGYMDDALKVFERLELVMPGDSARYQKMGYAEERQGNHHKAIRLYHRAELLDKENAWTTRRLAAAYRAVGDNDMALRYYRQLSSLQPDDTSVALLLGYVLLEKHDYDGALNQFYKVEFMDDKSSRAWRPLAWTLLLKGKYADARRYYEKILNDNPTASDYLNMGHAALAAADVRSAINYYKMSIEKSGAGGHKAFMQSMSQDADAMAQAGVDMQIVPLVMDATLE